MPASGYSSSRQNQQGSRPKYTKRLLSRARPAAIVALRQSTVTTYGVVGPRPRLTLDSFYPSTPVPPLAFYVPTTTLSNASTSTTSRPTLAELRLDGFTWVESLLDASADNIVLPNNDTSVTLKVSKDSVAPKEASGDSECASAVSGGAGLCVYLSRCDAAKDITVDVYRTTYCTVSQGYAGVCCPQNKIDLTH